MSRPLRTPDVTVLLRTDDLFVVAKPAGLATTAPDPRTPTLVAWVRAHDQGAELHHPTSRLDKEVSGIVTFARTRHAARALLEARRRRNYSRLYLAITLLPGPDERVAIATAPTWSSPIGPHPTNPRLRAVTPAGLVAETHARIHARSPNALLLALYPRTGRTHQLRVHAEHHGLPLFGDVSYGGARRIALANGAMVSASRTMLHCARIEIPDPETSARRVITLRPPEDFSRAWRELGGDGAALDEDRLE